MNMTNEELLTKVAVFKALGHPARLTMVAALTEGEQCVCELQRLVGSDTSTVSKHLAVLKQAGVVQDRKEGLWVYYRLRTPCVRQLLDCFTALPNKEEGEIVAAGSLSTPAVAIDGTISPAGASQNGGGAAVVRARTFQVTEAETVNRLNTWRRAHGGSPLLR